MQHDSLPAVCKDVSFHTKNRVLLKHLMPLKIQSTPSIFPMCNDATLQVMCMLDRRSLYQFSKTCTLIHRLSNNPIAWKHLSFKFGKFLFNMFLDIFLKFTSTPWYCFVTNVVEEKKIRSYMNKFPLHIHGLHVSDTQTSLYSDLMNKFQKHNQQVDVYSSLSHATFTEYQPNYMENLVMLQNVHGCLLDSTKDICTTIVTYLYPQDMYDDDYKELARIEKYGPDDIGITEEMYLELACPWCRGWCCDGTCALKIYEWPDRCCTNDYADDCASALVLPSSHRESKKNSRIKRKKKEEKEASDF